MTDNANHAAPTAEASQSAGLKSTDTGVVGPAIKAAAEAAQAPPKPESAKPAGTGTASGEARDDDTQEAPQGENDATSADASTDGKRKDRLPRWVQERMERVRTQTEAETERRIRAELAQQSQQQAPQHDRREQNVAATTDKAPTLADFDFDMERYTAHMIERGIAAREQAEQRKIAERREAEAVEEFKAKIDDFESRIGDGAWADIVESPINTDPAFAQLTELFMGSDHDLEIAHHLATNLTEARRINALPPLQRAVAVHQLAESFAGTTQASPQAIPARDTKPAPLPKKTTNAPPPPPRANGSGKSQVDIDDPNISTADRIKAWQAAKARS